VLVKDPKTGKKTKKVPVYKYATGRLDDWGPSSEVVATAKTAAKKYEKVDIKTVIDVSPEIANKLGLSNTDGTCTINGSKVKGTDTIGIGASDGQTVEIAFQ
jgi:hypothetical protein